jgi:hypothetical protein
MGALWAADIGDEMILRPKMLLGESGIGARGGTGAEETGAEETGTALGGGRPDDSELLEGREGASEATEAAVGMQELLVSGGTVSELASCCRAEMGGNR